MLDGRVQIPEQAVEWRSGLRTHGPRGVRARRAEGTDPGGTGTV
nr:hypothetical protein GCM10020063_006920 [Dactylosporangium thailandense]